MTIIDYKKAIAPDYDAANKRIVLRRNARTFQLAMYAVTRNASWAADRGLKIEGYPLAMIDIVVNRNAFLLEVGDQFVFNYPHWGISGMVCRILRITEDDVESGRLNIQAMEDIDHLSQEVFGDVQEGLWPIAPQFLGALDDVSIIESPFALSGDAIQVIPLAAKKTGNETGYYLYMSFDGGSSYQKIGTIGSFAIHGTLAEAYPADTYKVDELTDGFLVDFDVANEEDLAAIQTITRGQMISGQNLALIGNEIITFKTVSPVTTTQYRISGIYRGRFDTEREDHSIADDFWFVGADLYQLVSNSELALGAGRKFKMVPFNLTTGGDVSAAIAVDYTIEGRALKPYPAGNLLANGSSVASYNKDIVLTWSSRFRGQPAGLGNPQVVVGALPTIEYSYTVEVYRLLTLIKTVTDLEAVTYTYTWAMNIADNAGLASQLTFKIKQVRNVNLESSQKEITVNHDWRFPVLATINTGTEVSGDWSNILERDGTLWQIEELTGTPCLRFSFLFNDVPEIGLRLFARCFYNGNPAHDKILEQYNYTLAQWDPVTGEADDFESRTTIREYFFNLLTGSDYNNNGQLELRVDHTSGGSAGHDFYIDFMGLDTPQRLYKWSPSTTTSTTTTSSSSSTTTTTTA